MKISLPWRSGGVGSSFSRLLSARALLLPVCAVELSGSIALAQLLVLRQASSRPMIDIALVAIAWTVFAWENTDNLFDSTQRAIVFTFV